MPATVWQILNKKCVQWPETEITDLWLASSAFGQVKTNLVRMFDAQSFDDIEGSLTKNLKKETKDHQTMPQCAMG